MGDLFSNIVDTPPITPLQRSMMTQCIHMGAAEHSCGDDVYATEAKYRTS